MSKMGTRSRLVIKRSIGKPIHLWMHWDGYFNGVGDWLCNQIRLLMTEYTQVQIADYLEDLGDIPDIEGDEATDSRGYQNFNTEHLIPFIEGKILYKNDECVDFQYEYILDFVDKTFTGIHVGVEERELTFQKIMDGVNISQYSSDRVNLIITMISAAFATLNETERERVIERIHEL